MKDVVNLLYHLPYLVVNQEEEEGEGKEVDNGRC